MDRGAPGAHGNGGMMLAVVLFPARLTVTLVLIAHDIVITFRDLHRAGRRGVL